MNGMENCAFQDKEQMTDLLSLEKYLAGCYNSFVVEAATPEVIRCFSEALSDTHCMQQQIFTEMNSRGWYPVTKAEDNKLQQTKQKFAVSVTQ